MNTNICYSNNIRILFEYRIIRSPLIRINLSLVWESGEFRKCKLRPRRGTSETFKTQRKWSVQFNRLAWMTDKTLVSWDMHSKVKGLPLVVRVAFVGQMHVREERSTRNCVNWPKRDAAVVGWGEKFAAKLCEQLAGDLQSTLKGQRSNFSSTLRGRQVIEGEFRGT